MIKDFKSRAEMLSYVENRVLVDVDKYARLLMRVGNIFKSAPDGIYNENTGQCLVDFAKGYYYIDPNKKRVRIFDLIGFENCDGDIYDHNGFLVVKKINLKRIPVCDDRPLFFKARYASAALVSKIMREYHSYFSESQSIPSFYDCVYSDLINDVNELHSKLIRIEDVITGDFDEVISQCAWKEIYFHNKNGQFIMDVLLDIRIKDFYDRKFDKIENHDETQDEQYR